MNMEIPDSENPWLAMAGMWDKDDPLVQEWKEVMKKNREKEDGELEDAWPAIFDR